MPNEKDFAWQEFAEKLVEIYRGEYSYFNIVESLIIARDVFNLNLKDGIQVKMIKGEEEK